MKRKVRMRENRADLFDEISVVQSKDSDKDNIQHSAESMKRTVSRILSFGFW